MTAAAFAAWAATHFAAAALGCWVGTRFRGKGVLMTSREMTVEELRAWAEGHAVEPYMPQARAVLRLLGRLENLGATGRGAGGAAVPPPGEPGEPLTFRLLAETNRRRCESPAGFNHRLADWSLSDWMTALVGEVGELANIVKKLNRVRDGVPGNDKTPGELEAAMAEEVGDVAIYLDLFAQRINCRLEDLVASKFNKTSKKINSPITLPEVA